MSLHALHTASGIGMLVCLVAKIGMQIYIDIRHGRMNGFLAEVLFFAKYLKPYRREVSPEFSDWKYSCNLLLRLVVLFLIMNATVGLLILF